MHHCRQKFFIVSVPFLYLSGHVVNRHGEIRDLIAPLDANTQRLVSTGAIHRRLCQHPQSVGYRVCKDRRNYGREEQRDNHGYLLIMFHNKNRLCDLTRMIRYIADSEDLSILLYGQRYKIEQFLALLTQSPRSLVVIAFHCIRNLRAP